MKKAQILITAGIILLILSAGIGMYSNRVYDTSQCIATFKGQDSVICRIGGSSIATTTLQGLFLIGVVLTMIGTAQYFQENKSR